MKAWGIIALVVAGLYWLQAVLIPLALAVLLTFLLSPVVSTLRRRGLGRVPSVLVTALLAISILGAGAWASTRSLKPAAEEQAHRKRLDARRERLFAELTAIEQQHRDHTIDPERYAVRRKELVAALERVYAELDGEAAA